MTKFERHREAKRWAIHLYSYTPQDRLPVHMRRTSDWASEAPALREAFMERGYRIVDGDLSATRF